METGEGGTLLEGELPFTPRARKVLKLAVNEAQNLGPHYMGTGYILLGLVQEKQSVVARVLESLGVNPDTIRKKLFLCLTKKQ